MRGGFPQVATNAWTRSPDTKLRDLFDAGATHAVEVRTASSKGEQPTGSIERVVLAAAICELALVALAGC